MPANPASQHYRWPKPLRVVIGRPRLFLCLLGGLVAMWLMPSAWPIATRALLAWNIGAWIYLALVGRMMFGATTQNIRQRARMQDEGAVTILIGAILAGLFSLGAIVLELATVKELHGADKIQHILLSIATILSAFAFIHVMFTLHYAHEYYAEWRQAPETPASERGGLSFPGSRQPDYVDFLYFSFVIGVASQTADVETVSRPMRLLVLLHGIIAFFFNTTLLALTINIAAGLI